MMGGSPLGPRELSSTPIRESGPAINRHFARCVAKHEDTAVACYGNTVYVHSLTEDGYRQANWAANVWGMVKTPWVGPDDRYVHESEQDQP